MIPPALISTDTLATHLNDPSWAVVDCRFDLTQPARGRAAYLDAHIPGAVYAHLDEDLAATHQPGRTGRHPLPSPDIFAITLSRWGIGPDTQVVVYDDASGVYAGRLWWMLRWMGHDAVSLLDGDWRAWQREGRAVRSGAETRPAATFVPHLRRHLVADAAEIAARLGDPTLRLLDARTLERFQGLNETIDPIA
ncbi:MAG: sulfurtransferase, partial [Caldilineaceae bacterium]